MAEPENLPARLELNLACAALPKLDVLSESDPFVVMYMSEVVGGASGPTSGGAWREYGRTETIDNCPNPSFVKRFGVDYYFEENQPLRFAVYDRDTKSEDLSQHDFIGEMTCVLSEIVTARGQTIVRPLKDPAHPARPRGTITVAAEEIRASKEVATFQFSASKVPTSSGLFGGCMGAGPREFFLSITRAKEGGTLATVHRSEVVRGEKGHLVFKPFEIDVQRLCMGDARHPLVLELFRHRADGAHTCIARAETTYGALKAAGTRVHFFAPGVARTSLGKPLALELAVDRVSVTQQDSFNDYLLGGCEISLIAAIDFTSSNGMPTHPDSLHNLGVGSDFASNPNEYMKAILSVGEILGHYDPNRAFAVYGFGAKLPPDWQVSHCWALNGDEANPFVRDVAGVIEAYVSTLRVVRLHGPTIFAQVIRRAAELAGKAAAAFTQQKQLYYMLLIITDGVINDMEATVGEIVRASDLPLSIVIVGVGDADFAYMRTLDADDVPLQANGQVMQRDIVQFVPYRDFKELHYSRLAKETLAEIPDQFLSYVRKKGIRANPPRAPAPVGEGLHGSQTGASLKAALEAAKAELQEEAAAAAPGPAAGASVSSLALPRSGSVSHAGSSQRLPRNASVSLRSPLQQAAAALAAGGSFSAARPPPAPAGTSLGSLRAAAPPGTVREDGEGEAGAEAGAGPWGGPAPPPEPGPSSSAAPAAAEDEGHYLRSLAAARGAPGPGARTGALPTAVLPRASSIAAGGGRPPALALAGRSASSALVANFASGASFSAGRPPAGNPSVSVKSTSDSEDRLNCKVRRPRAAGARARGGPPQICMAAEVNRVLVPCRHACTCAACCEILLGQNAARCPICRQPVYTSMELFLS